MWSANKEVAKKTQGLVYRTKPMRLLTFNGSTFDLKYLAIHGATGLGSVDGNCYATTCDCCITSCDIA